MYEVSYNNIILYGSSLPTVEDTKEESSNYDNSNTVRVDDPTNIDRVEAIVKNMNR